MLNKRLLQSSSFIQKNSLTVWSLVCSGCLKTEISLEKNPDRVVFLMRLRVRQQTLVSSVPHIRSPFSPPPRTSSFLGPDSGVGDVSLTPAASLHQSTACPVLLGRSEQLQRRCGLAGITLALTRVREDQARRNCLLSSLRGPRGNANNVRLCFALMYPLCPLQHGCSSSARSAVRLLFGVSCPLHFLRSRSTVSHTATVLTQ